MCTFASGIFISSSYWSLNFSGTCQNKIYFQLQYLSPPSKSLHSPTYSTPVHMDWHRVCMESELFWMAVHAESKHLCLIVLRHADSAWASLSQKSMSLDLLGLGLCPLIMGTKIVYKQELNLWCVDYIIT
jgi:hypothetical protein